MTMRNVSMFVFVCFMFALTFVNSTAMMRKCVKTPPPPPAPVCTTKTFQSGSNAGRSGQNQQEEKMSPPEDYVLISVDVCTNDKFNGIKLTYRNLKTGAAVPGNWYGRQVGNCETFNLNSGERITAFAWGATSDPVMVTFHTNQRASPQYGTGNFAGSYSGTSNIEGENIYGITATLDQAYLTSFTLLSYTRTCK